MNLSVLSTVQFNIGRREKKAYVLADLPWTLCDGQHWDRIARVFLNDDGSLNPALQRAVERKMAVAEVLGVPTLLFVDNSDEKSRRELGLYMEARKAHRTIGEFLSQVANSSWPFDPS